MKLSHRFEEALVFAAQLHASQLRKGASIPYVSHLLGTASLALQYGANEDQAIAALLHDAVEDQGGKKTLGEIQRRFGAAVAELVDGCTDSDTIPKPPWRQRKEAYLVRLQSAPPEVLLVSVCDKIDNARTILADLRTDGDQLWTRFTGGKEGTLWYYRALRDAFLAAGPAVPARELARLVREIEVLVLAQAESGA